MVGPLDEGASPSEEPPRRTSTRSILIVAVVVVIAGPFVTGILPLPITFAPRGPTVAQRLEDLTHLRDMAGLLLSRRFFGDDVPVAPDGRIDVYAVLRSELSDRKEIVETCRSSRTGKGPTWEEIEGGDYTSFPYQRRKGAVDPEARCPVLWDREPFELRSRDHPPSKGRLVAFSDGSFEFEEEAAFRKFLDENPGQE